MIMNPEWNDSFLGQIAQIKKGNYKLTFSNSTNITKPIERELQDLAIHFQSVINQLHSLIKLSTTVHNHHNLLDVLNCIFSSFNEVIPYDRIGYASIIEQHDEPYVKAFWVKTKYSHNQQIKEGYTVRLSDVSLNHLVETKEYRIINDLEEYFQSNPQSQSTRLIRKEGILSSLTIPLFAEDTCLGFLFFSSQEKNTYQNIHIQLFSMLANHVANAIQKSSIYEDICRLNQELNKTLQKLEKKATTDFLTGLKNKEVITELLQHQLNLTERKNCHLSILIIDIDHFKQINDTYGHLKGDEVLSKVANLITETLRTSDAIGRIGGEEFLVVLPETNTAGALIVAERIRLQIAQYRFKNFEDNFSANISIGISSTEIEMPDRDMKTLLLRADSALYDAKNTGRNRCAII